MVLRKTFCVLALAALSACMSAPPDISEHHLVTNDQVGLHQQESVKLPDEPIPDIVQVTPFLSKPTATEKEEHYTVVLHDIPVRELLFTLARDSNINIDIHPDIKGNVTINAVEETLTSILERLARQVDFIYEYKHDVLVIHPDSKFWHTYNVDYLSMKRKSSGSMSLSLEAGGDVEASSKADVDTENDNEFWDPIIDGIKAIIETDDAQRAAEAEARAAAEDTKKSDGDGSEGETGGDAAAAEQPAEADAAAPAAGGEGGGEGAGDSVIAHQATGVISVLATTRQHEQIAYLRRRPP